MGDKHRHKTVLVELKKACKLPCAKLSFGKCVVADIQLLALSSCADQIQPPGHLVSSELESRLCSESVPPETLAHLYRRLKIFTVFTKPTKSINHNTCSVPRRVIFTIVKDLLPGAPVVMNYGRQFCVRDFDPRCQCVTCAAE